jgi:hypothetical protein
MAFTPPAVNPLVVPMGTPVHVSFLEFDINGDPITPESGAMDIVYSTGNANPSLTTAIAAFTLDANGLGGTFTAVAQGSGGVRISAAAGGDTVYSALFTVEVPWNVASVGFTSP